MSKLNLMTFLAILLASTLTLSAQEQDAQEGTWTIDNGEKIKSINEYVDYQQQAVSVGYPRLDSQKTRKIIFKNDDDQNYITTRIFKLEHVIAADILPYVKNAIIRHGVGAVDRINYTTPAGKNEQYLVITTSWKMMPYVEDMVEKLDYKCDPLASRYYDWAGYNIEKEARPTVVYGTGITRMTYQPKYRGGITMGNVINDVVKSSSCGSLTWDSNRNVFYFKDAYSKAIDIGKYLKEMDRPLPQVHFEFKVYEMSESNAMELGFDWMAWKNGPAAGIPFFSTGLDNLETWAGGLEKAMEIPAYSYGGVFFAPQFDASFLKCLDDANRVNARTSGSIMVNHGMSANVNFTPDFQSIYKTTGDILSVSGNSSVKQGYTLHINNPTLCFNSTKSSGARTGENMMFNMSLTSNTVTGRNNLGKMEVAGNNVNTDMTLKVGVEKLVNTISVEREIVQEHGIPYLSDIPYVKYIFGYSQKNVLKTRYYLTVKATPVPSESESFKPFTFTND